MKRRDFIGLLGSTIAAWPTLGRAQSPNRVFRLGHLGNTVPTEALTRETTLPELARLGFVEGRNLIFDARIGEADALPGLMSELVAARPDAVIAIGAPAIAAAGATRAVPIVTFGADPVQLGLAASYARPGGNVTGVVILISQLEVKRLSMLREALPERRRVAVLTSQATALGEGALRQASAGLGVDLMVFSVATPHDYRAAFAAMQAAGVQALLVSATSTFFRDGKQLAELALEARLPTICEWAEMAQAGCLFGYGPNRAALRRRMADQIARIFRGTAPGEIAIEQPVVFEFAVNQRIAKALGVSIPLSILTQAGDVFD
ncbi:MAG: ABC transporter substrate-binding protein [Burkholderiales bacterium]|nr:ABC transporter substrate-binding protein [Burkholderiales bacterium]